MAVGRVFFLCSPNCPKQPRTSFPFYKFFYTTICRVGSLYISKIKTERKIATIFLAFSENWNLNFKSVRFEKGLSLGFCKFHTRSWNSINDFGICERKKLKWKIRRFAEPKIITKVIVWVWNTLGSDHCG